MVVIVVVIVCINGSCRSGCSRGSDVVDILVVVLLLCVFRICSCVNSISGRIFSNRVC